MGVDTVITLPFRVRVEDVAEVIGVLAGLKPERHAINGENCYVRVPGASATPSTMAACANINIEAGGFGHRPRVIVEFPVSACFNRRSTTDAHPALAFRPTLPALVRTHGNGLVYPRRRRTSRTIEVSANLELGNTVGGLTRRTPAQPFDYADFKIHLTRE